MPYVFLHGLGQTASSWDRVIKAVGKGREIVCPGLPELVRGREVSYSNLYRAFSESCAKSTGPLHLCGLSLGGVLALQYGIENPDRVSSIVLIGTQYVMPKGLLRFQNIIFQIMPDRAFQETGFAKKDFIGLCKSMMDLDFRKSLSGIDCPVLVVCGEKDRANKAASRQLAGLLPHAGLCMVEGAGHEVNMDAPEKLSRILDEFYRK